ncbi:hypothetical protein U4960_09615 [Altererythrobacter sp. H2]|uniref:Uncharacterized protein n=1 Tax=Qipengyuania vulgaris TaxID=291985 RepID=A0A844XQ70_9SPHN|nr:MULTISPECIES: hypothetical protein [Erythrobacteraceae]MXO48111.1 hypothetical protein [Qipengyuania vulgaris]WRK94557.1 hypothetical protein U4960_09615 [Altererythrobacter sp. H2]
MNPRKLIGGTAFCMLLLWGWAASYIGGISQDDWGLLWRLAYVIWLCVTFVMAFYDRKNLPEKAWDFNPKRGVLYFFLGWIIFPVLIGVEALSGADFTLSRMLVGTLAMSVLIGILGIFTENVGV